MTECSFHCLLASISLIILKRPSTRKNDVLAGTLAVCMRISKNKILSMRMVSNDRLHSRFCLFCLAGNLFRPFLLSDFREFHLVFSDHRGRMEGTMHLYDAMKAQIRGLNMPYRLLKYALILSIAYCMWMRYLVCHNHGPLPVLTFLEKQNLVSPIWCSGRTPRCMFAGRKQRRRIFELCLPQSFCLQCLVP